MTDPGTRSELDDLREHLERYRGVTLQFLEILSHEDYSWRPGPDSFSCGQHLLHIAQAEDYHAAGLFTGNWDTELLRLPKEVPGRDELRPYFADVRARTLSHLTGLSEAELSRLVEIPGAPVQWSLRSWLWFVLEHELHHKAQLAVYLRQMGRTAPFYALALPPGERPDFQARQDLGGF